MNARVTFKNVPLHTLSKFTFKDVNAACLEFKKIPALTNASLFKLQAGLKYSLSTMWRLLIRLMPDERKARYLY